MNWRIHIAHGIFRLTVTIGFLDLGILGAKPAIRMESRVAQPFALGRGGTNAITFATATGCAETKTVIGQARQATLHCRDIAAGTNRPALGTAGFTATVGK